MKKWLQDRKRNSNQITASASIPNNPRWCFAICKFCKSIPSDVLPCFANQSNQMSRVQSGQNLRKFKAQTNFVFWNFATIICFLSEISCDKNKGIACQAQVWGLSLSSSLNLNEWRANNIISLYSFEFNGPGTTCAF